MLQLHSTIALRMKKSSYRDIYSIGFLDGFRAGASTVNESCEEKKVARSETFLVEKKKARDWAIAQGFIKK